MNNPDLTKVCKTYFSFEFYALDLNNIHSSSINYLNFYIVCMDPSKLLTKSNAP